MQLKLRRSIVLMVGLAIGGCATGKTPPAKTKMVRIEGADQLKFTFGTGEYCDDGVEIPELEYCENKTASQITKIMNDADEHPPSLPTVSVTLSPFEIDEHEVTNLQYLHCVEVDGCTEPKFGNAGDITKYYNRSDGKYDDFPIVSVTWEQAKYYCSIQGKRLPTEYEWELVATMAGTKSAPWGNSLGDCSGKSVAIKGCNLKLFATGTYGPQRVKTSTDDVVSFGGQEVFDMGGNVSEWVEDIYHRFQTCKDEIASNTCDPAAHPDCYSLCPNDANVDVCNAYPASEQPLSNPQSQETGDGDFCFRGGSYAHVTTVTNTAEAPLCSARSQDRSQREGAGKTRTYLGFRCARDL